MDSVQESSRCKQTKPSLWPTRPAGRIRDHSPVARAGLSPGLAWYAPRAIASRTPVQALAKDQTTGGREIARKGSPRPAAVPRTRHTQIEQALVERTHRERPLTAVDSTQIAIGSWQTAVGSTQSAVSEGGDIAHAHARNDTTPRPPRPVEECTDPDTRRTNPTGTPRPGQRSRTGPAPAPARPWTPDGPTRRTDSTTATAASAVAVGAQARQPRQPRPRQHTPTPATPAPVAAGPNPNRHDASTRQHTLTSATPASVAASLNPNRHDAPLRQHTGPQPLTMPSLPA